MARTVKIVVMLLCFLAVGGLAAKESDVRPCEGVADRDVIPLERPRPAYPVEAAMFCVEGLARYTFTIRPDGRVAGVEVVESVPEGVFDHTARIFDFWRFSPRCVDGEAVSRRATQSVDFRLDSADKVHCPDALPESAVSLQVELVALMQRVHEAMARGEIPDIEERPRLDAPYATIEQVYRRSMADQVAFVIEEVGPVASQFQALIGRAESTPGLDLDEHVERLENLRIRYEDSAAGWRPLIDRFLDDLRSAADSVELAPGERQLFVDQLIDEPQAVYAQLGPVTEPGIRLMKQEAGLSRWLSEHAHEWDFHRGRLRFASDQLNKEFLELVEARDEALADIELQIAQEDMMWSGR